MKINTKIQGDCIKEMKKLPENSVDAIITDPPYGLEFMGKEWDKFEKKKRFGIKGEEGENDLKVKKNFKVLPRFYKSDSSQLQQFCYSWAIECLRVLKPGGFLLSMGGTRTYHRLVCGIEDAGFEIRDTIMWLYGSGFPKSLNIGKQVDKIQGNKRESKGIVKGMGTRPNVLEFADRPIKNKFELTEGNSEWEGWGTALKPACEPIVVARKPLSEKNVALNVLKWGTGGINIDACRIEHNEKVKETNRKERQSETWKEGSGFKNEEVTLASANPQGRFPANIIFDEESGKMLDEQTGELKSGSGAIKKATAKGYQGNDYGVESRPIGTEMISHNDKGGASRFFYCAKASKSERNFGCEDFETKAKCEIDKMGGEKCSMKTGSGNERNVAYKNNHPTVKPIALMEYLIKLVSKEGAVVLDPFLGSGTTLLACYKLNRNGIGIEKEEEYIKICKARIKPFLEQTKIT